MRQLFFLTFISLFVTTVFSQTTPAKEESDPKAKAVLEKMRKKYEVYQSLEANFTIAVELPEQPTAYEKGSLVQQGEKYRLTLDDRILVSDNESVWLYLKKNQEVQINDVEEDSEESTISSPKDLLKAYEWKDYIYALVNEFAENGRVIQQIEFKPTDRDSDYSKIRLTLDKKTLEVVRTKAFGKDGSRITITVDKFKPNASVNANIFSFTKDECPDCHFEDLRMD